MFLCNAGDASFTQTGVVHLIRAFEETQEVGVPVFVWVEGFSLEREIYANNLRFVLRNPVAVSVGWEEGLWVYSAPALGVQSFGPSRREAESSFFEDFAVLYQEIALEDDENLAADAIQMKQAFLNTVADLQPIQ